MSKEKLTTKFQTPKNNDGITLIALIITIVVMLILVAVTLSMALGNNGIIGKSKEASMETEKQSIYEVIVSAMKMRESGYIDVKGTYDEANTLLTNEGKVVTPDTPATDDQITDETEMVILDVQGKFGTYTYTIKKDEIIIGRGEIIESISGVTSYPYCLRIEPKGENLFTEDEASALVAEKEFGDNSVTSLEELLVAMYKGATENNDNSVSYDEAKEWLEELTGTTISSPQDAFEKTMTYIGYNYSTVQEYATDLYEAEEKKLMVNGEEATTGVTWDGNTAIYTIQDRATYNLELILDGKSANTMKVQIDGYAADLEELGEVLVGMTYAEWNSLYQSGFADNSETEFDESQLEIYRSVSDEYGVGVKYNDNIYGLYMEYIDSVLYITRIDLL